MHFALWRPGKSGQHTGVPKMVHTQHFALREGGSSSSPLHTTTGKHVRWRDCVCHPHAAFVLFDFKGDGRA